MNQRVFPTELWNALVPTLLSSLASSSSKTVLDLGLALRGIEKFPRHARSHTLEIASEQAGPRGQYWRIDIRVEPDSISVSAHKMEAYFDGAWTVLDGFSAAISVEDAIATPQACPILNDGLMPELVVELTSARKWWTKVVRKSSPQKSD
ncbi:MAG: hypothetical protein H7274_10065 [Rhodoferax sp.]|nr:hypothetical protein [Rhodoferax sp.]